MKITKLLSVLALGASVAACGGSSTQAAEPAHAETEGAEHPEGHPTIPPELSALHDVLAPTWHSEPGATRAGMACTNAARLDEESRALAAAPAPEGVDAAQWGATAEQLTAGSAALVAECGASGPAVEERLATFHDAFHALLDLRH
jgi:hypothetical protein